MRHWKAPLAAGIVALGIVAACDQPSQQSTAPTGPVFSATKTTEQQDAALLRRVKAINSQLAASRKKVAIEAIDFFTIGAGRPGVRIHQQSLRWVPNDDRRLAAGDSITYIFDQSGGATASGLTSAQTEAAIDAALTTWANDAALKKVDIVKRADPGTDITIFDGFFGFGGFGDPFAADIVEAGFFPRAFFDSVGGPGGGRGILAFSVSFIFVDDNGNPTDINGDGYLDTALNEVYYNNTFGDPSNDRAGNPWGINVALPGVDVQTVGLHENGHSLELGHFGPPPAAVMNPVYAGIRQSPFASDDAGMNAVWSSWPNP